MPTAQLLSGTELARAIVDRAARRSTDLRSEIGRPPCLATVLVGDDPASVTYVKMKQNRCAKAGIESRRVTLGEATTTEQLVAVITALSEDPSVHGILLQHPVPSGIDERAAFEAIDR